jgi:hypothetical protein
VDKLGGYLRERDVDHLGVGDEGEVTVSEVEKHG